jgi:hypothetical protein
VVLDQLPEQLARQQRRRRVEDEHGAVEAVEGLLRARDGVTGSSRLLLHGDGDAVVGIARVGRCDDDERVRTDGP